MPLPAWQLPSSKPARRQAFTGTGTQDALSSSAPASVPAGIGLGWWAQLSKARGM